MWTSHRNSVYSARLGPNLESEPNKGKLTLPSLRSQQAPRGSGRPGAEGYTGTLTLGIPGWEILAFVFVNTCLTLMMNGHCGEATSFLRLQHLYDLFI